MIIFDYVFTAITFYSTVLLSIYCIIIMPFVFALLSTVILRDPDMLLFIFLLMNSSITGLDNKIMCYLPLIEVLRT